MTHRFQKTLVVLLTLVLVGFSWLGRFGLTAEANVTLVSFDVVRGAAPTGLDVVWETATETDLVGFRVKRSATEDQQGATTIATVPQQGTATTGASYTYPDGNLTTGQTYYYWLYELTSNGEEVLITPNPESETPGGLSSPTNTPTLTPTTVPTQQPTTTPTTQVSSPKQPTSTPTVPQGVNPSPTPTTPPTEATATFTVPPQATNTPIGNVPLQQPTNTSVPVAQGQPTNTPVVSVPTPIVEGAVSTPDVATPEVQAGATVGTTLVDGAQPADQTLQVPPTPTQVLDGAATGGTTSDVTPTAETTESTPQAIAQESTSGSAASTERLARPTATPRPTATTESGGGSGSLLLILGGASLFGAVLLALAALVIWRRR